MSRFTLNGLKFFWKSEDEVSFPYGRSSHQFSNLILANLRNECLLIVIKLIGFSSGRYNSWIHSHFKALLSWSPLWTCGHSWNTLTFTIIIGRILVNAMNFQLKLLKIIFVMDAVLYETILLPTKLIFQAL